MKKVLVIIVDALATRVVDPALEEGRLPHFAALAAAGVMRRESVAVFPSITPAATCTLVTGCYPLQHGIAGAYWYDAERDDVAYFGTDIWPILKEGVGRYLRDFQQELNLHRLQVPTIFQRIEEHGHLRDGVINLPWFRGTVEHEVSFPALLKLLPGANCGPLLGPHLMFMGDFVNTPLDRSGRTLSARGGVSRRFGFHDETTADYLLHLAREDSLPEFMLAYFPNNDFDSHEQGPAKSVSTLESVDRCLGRLFEIHGGLPSMLDDFAIVVTGDHSQSDLDPEEDSGVNLDKVLAQFQVVEAGCTWESDDDVMVCPNLRAAQIYLRKNSWDRRSDVVRCLLACDHVDQVMWCEGKDGLEDTEDAVFHVATRDRGSLAFGPAREAPAMGTDPFGGTWHWDGDLAPFDATLTPAGELVFRDYPNAFERVATSFFRKSGNIWVTARLGRELCLPGTTSYRGGSHGSLHAHDSLSPLIVAGLPTGISLPQHVRSVDVVPLCLNLLDLESEHAVGASHVMGTRSKSS